LDLLGPEVLALGAAWYVVLIFSLTVHEACHAWAALRGGDRTAYLGGQVSLDPMPHMRREPFGTVIVPIAVYALTGGGWMIGWASTPYDAAWAQRHPRRAGWMSLAGPAGNLVLVLLAAMVLRVGMASDVFVPEPEGFAHLVGAAEGSAWTAVAAVASILFSLNLVLLVFNLFPVPPLDGAGALSLLIPDEYTAVRVQAFLASPGLSLMGLIAAWYLFPRVFFPVHAFALDVLYAGYPPW
jgi:Zn-dependent protease